ncbi:hypothetical protein PR048_023731 [Dryococelus australis]|uniref:Reverse transcriptase domain-containing protein n=1 Tax=Dryococelus australis TaxID=614101 RepID=A0ABQ9GUW0_9NEOP|nr:hypothetical protein PR048_023731 [Dryococelus australis]
MRLIDFATKRNLNIVSTFSPHKNIHKITWCSPDKHTINQIDHALVDARHRTMVEDVRSLRGAEVGSEHFLVMTYKNGEKKDKIEEFMVALRNRFAELAETQETEVEGAWKAIKDGLREFWSLVETKIRNKHWFNEKCREITEKKKAARKKWLTDKNDEEMVNEYKQVGYVARIDLIKDNGGTLITDEEKALEKWRQYFEELLSSSTLVIDENGEAIFQNVQPWVEKPTTEEYNKIHQLITLIWEKEAIPEEWKESVMCPIFKKGDSMMCANYRGISLLCVAYKVLSMILLRKLTPYMEETVGYQQVGFRKNKLTICMFYRE